MELHSLLVELKDQTPAAADLLVESDNLLLPNAKYPDGPRFGLLLLVTHITVRWRFSSQIPNYLFLDLSGPKKPNSKRSPEEIKV